MTQIEHRLCLAGLMLFFLALLQGFVIPVFERLEVARAAHATALGSGTFLVAIGLLWPKLSFRRAAPVWAGVLASSLYAIAAGLMLSATYAAGSEAAHRAVSLMSATLTIGGSIALVVSLGVVMLACKPSIS
jgi:hydroxylaminobenzene mutase